MFYRLMSIIYNFTNCTGRTWQLTLGGLRHQSGSVVQPRITTHYTRHPRDTDKRWKGNLL